jgi:ribosomal protein L7/L12
MSDRLYNKIRQVSNGYIVTDSSGNEQVALTLIDAARLIGETIPAPGATTYAPGYGSYNIESVNTHAQRGETIAAIRELRDCFAPRLGLREAKDIVDCLRGKL